MLTALMFMRCCCVLADWGEDWGADEWSGSVSIYKCFVDVVSVGDF